MQTFRNNCFRVLFTLVVLLVFSRSSFGGNSIVLLVEQPSAKNLPLTIATTQSALDNFMKKNDDDAELAIVSYSTTADVIRPFSVFNNDSSNDLAGELKTYGARVDNINTASGMERAIALLNSEAMVGNKKILLVISDANISTGDKELDVQFTEWLTEIISEDAVNSEIEVNWHPITDDANHENIDTFLARLNGRRIVLSPEPELIDQAAAPPATSDAEQQLDLLTESLAAVNTEADVVSTTAVVEEVPITATQDDIRHDESLPESSLVITEPTIEKNAETFELEIPELDSNEGDVTEQVPTDIPASSLLTPSNIKLTVLIIIALAAIFLLKTLLSKRRDSDVSGTSLADKEYRDSSDVAVKVTSGITSSAATKINAPMPPPQTTSSANAPSKNFSVLEPIPKPLDETPNNPKTDHSEYNDETAEDAMDSTQDVFPEFSSASLTAVKAEEPKDELAPQEVAVEANDEVDSPEEVSPQAPVSEVDPYATVIAETPVVDPYATVIADASQIREYAKQFSEGHVENDTNEVSNNTSEDDPDKTVLHQTIKKP